MDKFKVAIIGATGLVGQCFISLLDDHPWFEVTTLVASERSKGKRYEDTMKGRWRYQEEMPDKVKDMIVLGVEDLKQLSDQLDFVFCAVDMPKEELIELEESIARLELPLISNNSAMRWMPDVPMIIPEINPDHCVLIESQRKRLGTKRGFIAVKPNCSVQSYMPALTPLLKFEPEAVMVSTYQAISGSGKTLASAGDMLNNVIPFIGGEEEKSEWEPRRIWGQVKGGRIELAAKPVISAQCYRVSVEYGHTAAVSVRFRKAVTETEIIESWKSYDGHKYTKDLPMAPDEFIRYMPEDNRPQPMTDAMHGRGMTISIGRLRKDPIFDYKFCCLSHNLIRGAAGGAILTAELLVKEGYLTHAQNRI